MVRTITLTNINMQSNLKWLNFVFFSEIITFIQTPEEHWLLRVPDLSAIYSHCDAVLGVILDQPRSHQCQGGSRSVIALCKHCTVWLLSSPEFVPPALAVVTQISLAGAGSCSEVILVWLLLCLPLLSGQALPELDCGLWMGPVCSGLASPGYGSQNWKNDQTNILSAAAHTFSLNSCYKASCGCLPLFFDRFQLCEVRRGRGSVWSCESGERGDCK